MFGCLIAIPLSFLLMLMFVWYYLNCILGIEKECDCLCVLTAILSYVSAVYIYLCSL